MIFYTCTVVHDIEINTRIEMKCMILLVYCCMNWTGSLFDATEKSGHYNNIIIIPSAVLDDDQML